MPAGAAACPGWASTAVTTPAAGATIRRCPAASLSAASLASSLASCARTAAALAVPVTALSCSLSALTAAASAVTTAAAPGADSVASNWFARTCWPTRTSTFATTPAVAKLRSTTPVLATDPVSTPRSAVTTWRTYQPQPSAHATATVRPRNRWPAVVCLACHRLRLPPGRDRPQRLPATSSAADPRGLASTRWSWYKDAVTLMPSPVGARPRLVC